MKKSTILISMLFLLVLTVNAQNDTMYIMKSSKVVGVYKVTEVDSIIFYKPAILANTVIDIDGNIYNTINIGSKTWMVENLRATRFNNGTVIPNISVNSAWSSQINPAYCWYNNDSATYAQSNGAYYNWYTINEGNVCPVGWHVPTYSEWVEMEDYLIDNGYNYDGSNTVDKIAKSIATDYGWAESTVEGAVGNTDYPSKRNSSGFSAKAVGFRDLGGVFGSINSQTFWWTSTEYNTTAANTRYMNYDLIILNETSHDKKLGLSVRCIKD